MSVVYDRIKITCKVCGRLSLCGKDEDPKSKKCGYCGHYFGIEVQSFADDVPNASSETHVRYSWFCSQCEHRGLKWVEKALDLVTCPKCNASLSSHITRQINPDKGSCKSIWDSEETGPIGIPKSATISPPRSGTCRTCGRKYSFRMTPPYRCDNCGENGENFRTQFKREEINQIVNGSAPPPKSGRNKYIDCSACGFHHSMHLAMPEVCAACGHPFSKIAEVQS